jgi:hypothetical protein
MPSSAGRCAKLPVCKLLPRAACVTAVAALLLIGCSRRTATVSPNIPPPLPNTPDGKLEGVMRRMRSALEAAHSAAGSGVKSMRTASVRKLESAANDAAVQAEVTVTTTVAVDQSKGDENPESEAAKQAELDEKGPGETQPPKTIEPVITQEKFLLAYDGSYWKIAQQPKDDIIRICIDDALKGQ